MASPLKLRVPLPRAFGPGEIFAAEGALAVLSALPASRVAALVSARGRQDPAVARWLAGAHAYEVRPIAPSWQGEPALDGLGGTLAELGDWRPDWIVAIGGGSVIDGAKLCWALHEHPCFARDRLGVPFALPPLRALSRFVAIPTTAATGSEASSSATFEESAGGAKVAAVTHDFLPDIAILDPRLLLSLQPTDLATGALDALGHAIEGYTSKLPNPMMDVLAEGAVATLADLMIRREPGGFDLAALSRLQVAACNAGHVQNLCLVGFAHALAHQLARYRIPHAIAVGLVLPHVMRYNATSSAIGERYDRLARSAGLGEGAALIAAIAALPQRFGLRTKLGAWCGDAAAPTADDFAAIAEHARADALSRFAPIDIPAEALEKMVRMAW